MKRRTLTPWIHDEARVIPLSTLLLSAALVVGCGGTSVPHDGPDMAITVGAWTPPGIDEVCYTLSVDNADGDPVWAQSPVCSTRYGDGEGAITYVGPCDATDPGGGAWNTVTLHIDGIYRATGDDEAPWEPIADWVDPCGPPHAPDGCKRRVLCEANRDAPVTFNLTLMRQANQGFFDIAVSFEDIFCSAKVDCTAPLVIDPDSGRRLPSIVLAFACTDGDPLATPATSTHLYMDDVVLRCGAIEHTIDPSRGPGNHFAERAEAPAPFVQAMTFVGAEALLNAGEPADKLYWNVALGLDEAFFEGLPTATTCRLETRATAASGELPGGLTPVDTNYPFVAVDVLVHTNGERVCTQHPLDGDAPNDGVATAFTGPLADLSGFASIRFGYEARRSGGAVVTEAIGGGCPSDTIDLSGDGDACATVEEFAMGMAHACAVSTANELYCWGWNGSGALGDGMLDDRALPTRIGAGTSWRSVSAGSGHTCAITTGGELYCWGGNYYGVVGDGGSETRPSPTRVGSDADWVEVTAGYSSTCGIRAGGELYCWGYNGDGGVGIGSTTEAERTPVRVGTSTGWTHVSAYGAHTCGLRDGDLYCWGYNENGQVGDGTLVDKLTPIAIGEPGGWTALAAGFSHTCAVRAGMLYCWGADFFGQVGSGGGQADQTTPLRIGADTGWSTVAAGIHHTCGIREGELHCWGSNDSGQLGDGTREVRDAPLRIGADSDWGAVFAGSYTSCGRRAGGHMCWGLNADGQIGARGRYTSTVPTRIDDDAGWTSVAAGGGEARPDGAHGCGIVAGDLVCWGANDAGQLGDGTSDMRTTPTQVGAAGSWTALAAGGEHTCGVRQGELYCWGSNVRGQVGDPGATTPSAPLRIGLATDWTIVSAGDRHTCGIRGGELYCWGGNESGQIGNGSSVDVGIPTRIGTGGGWSAVSAGTSHTCGVESGAMYCWGDDADGKLGNGVGGSTPTPVQVGVASGWTAVTAGTAHTCGVREGELYCWGANGSGQLGDGTFEPAAVPVRIGTGVGWSAIAAGSAQSCGVDAGVLYCWGSNAVGQLGDGTKTDRGTPVQVGSAADWSHVGTSRSPSGPQTCGIRAGVAYCWGSNATSQLGTGDTLSPGPLTF